MCSKKTSEFSNQKFPGTASIKGMLLAALGASTLLLSAHNAAAQAVCSTALSDGPTWLEAKAHVGDTVHFIISLDAVDGVCKLSGGTNFVVLPDNTLVHIVDGYAKPACGAGSAISIQCPGGAGCLGTIPDSGGFFTYVVKPGDVNLVLTATTPRGTSIPAGFSGQPGFIFVGALSDADAFDCVTSASKGKAAGFGTQPLQILSPSLTITKQCVTNCAPYSSPYGSPISFTGTVCNNGDTILNNVTVVDDPDTAITFATTTSFGTNSFPAGGAGTLLPGECVTYSGSYSPAGSGVALCGPFTDTVVASGTDTADVPLTVYATNSATCLVCTTPCVEVTKVCGPATLNYPASTSYEVSGAVTNCGNVPLTNVVVVDVVTNAAGVVTTNAVTTIPLLGITAADNFALLGPITINVEGCGPSSDYLAVTASGLCGGDVNDRSDTCTTTFLCPPDICVTKGVVCAPASGDPCGPTLAYAPSATGVAGPTNQAAFCYQIIVWNCGNDVLTNVTVVDNKIGTVAGSFPTTLGIGERATNYYQQSYGPDTSTTNVVTATGTGQSSGITTNKVAQAIANVLSLGVECDITLSSSGAVEGGNCEVTLDSNAGSNQPVTFTLVVTNTGKVDLDVALVGVPALVDCQDPTNAVSVPASVLIPVGQSYTVSGCVPVSCPGADFNVTVQGTANAGTNDLCIYDAEGHAVTTAPSQCAAHVCCVSPVTCRTTGGGTLIPDYVNQSCIEVTTTLLPLKSAEGQDLVKVTHGGQLGAPYAHKDCGEVLGNPCIRGQWEHTRHYQGKGNPRDVVTAFHTVTPKGQFDTLSCACLPCCDPDTGEIIPATIGPGKKFELCNPDDHKICGPMPRPAPANALIWTGLGQKKQASDTGTKPAKWVILRVYIEDRSEPGGGHPLGSVDPADIYSYQAWDTGIEVSKKPDFNAIAPAFRAALGADSCAFLEALASGALPIGSLPSSTVNGLTADVIDQGPLHDGNRQIHPSTSATCTP